MTRRDLLSRAALGLALAALAACGKKPDVLKPPEGADPARFPRPYPNPRYDRPSE